MSFQDKSFQVFKALSHQSGNSQLSADIAISEFFEKYPMLSSVVFRNTSNNDDEGGSYASYQIDSFTPDIGKLYLMFTENWENDAEKVFECFDDLALIENESELNKIRALFPQAKNKEALAALKVIFDSLNEAQRENLFEAVFEHEGLFDCYHNELTEFGQEIYDSTSEYKIENPNVSPDDVLRDQVDFGRVLVNIDVLMTLLDETQNPEVLERLIATAGQGHNNVAKELKDELTEKVEHLNSQERESDVGQVFIPNR